MHDQLRHAQRLRLATECRVWHVDWILTLLCVCGELVAIIAQLLLIRYGRFLHIMQLASILPYNYCTLTLSPKVLWVCAQ